MAKTKFSSDKRADEVFQELTDKRIHKFDPNKFILRGGPPLRNRIGKISKNKLIDELDGSLSMKYTDHISGKFVIIRLNTTIRNAPRLKKQQGTLQTDISC